MGPWTVRGASYEKTQAVAEVINGSGLKAKAFTDVRPAQWSKLLFNSAVNSIGAVTNLPHDGLTAGRSRVSRNSGYITATQASELSTGTG